ncbi:unnamed protein product [Polarella glacialis]|uniref:Uncharacterized protein n=1 Tax=Polarella glacialis TaxID=89957 RepID=A0A813FLY5_POLGL|nr:unnamed protein product [Polarella glacialis]
MALAALSTWPLLPARVGSADRPLLKRQRPGSALCNHDAAVFMAFPLSGGSSSSSDTGLGNAGFRSPDCALGAVLAGGLGLSVARSSPWGSTLGRRGSVRSRRGARQAEGAWKSWRRKLERTDWQFAIAILAVFIGVAAATSALGNGGSLFPSSSQGFGQLLGWKSRRSWWPGSRQQDPLAWLAALFGGREGLLLASALALCALAASQSKRFGRFSSAPRRREVPSAPRQLRVSSQRPSSSRSEFLLPTVLLADQAEAEAVAAFRAFRARIKEGDELRSVIEFESWGEGGYPKRPLLRSELRILLEEAARKGRQLSLITSLAASLERTGVPLDWAAEHDCSESFGRYALDFAIEAAVNENSDEQVALKLLDLGMASGAGNTSKLNANPWLRAAAGRGMLQLVNRLIAECGADVNSVDPRFGSTALDKAADAGRDQVALRLLELGADVSVGRGVDYKLARVGPQVRSSLVAASAKSAAAPRAPSTESKGLTDKAFGEFRRQFGQNSERQSIQALDTLRDSAGGLLTSGQLALLLEDVARDGYRPALLRRLCSDLESAGIAFGWEKGTDVLKGTGTFGQRPLDQALQTAAEENSDERAALLLLDTGLAATSGRPVRLNANPLLRTAATRCLPRLAERLVLKAAADCDAADPRFGTTALDRAVSAGCDAVAKKLLELGASPDAGRGRSYLLSVASPKVSSLIRSAGQ